MLKSTKCYCFVSCTLLLITRSSIASPFPPVISAESRCYLPSPPTSFLPFFTHSHFLLLINANPPVWSSVITLPPPQLPAPHSPCPPSSPLSSHIQSPPSHLTSLSTHKCVDKLLTPSAANAFSGPKYWRLKKTFMEYIVHGSKNQIDSSFFIYFGVVSLKRMRRFDLLTTDLGHALVSTQILPPVSGSSHRLPMRDQDL